MFPNNGEMKMFRKFWITSLVVGFSILSSLIVPTICKSQEASAVARPDCYEPGTRFCDTGTSGVCPGQLCVTWYFDPHINAWTRTGEPGWATKVSCAKNSTLQYIGALEVPFAENVVEGTGRSEKELLGDVTCVTTSICNCENKESVLGTPCAGDPPYAIQTIESSKPDTDAPECEVIVIIIDPE